MNGIFDHIGQPNEVGGTITREQIEKARDKILSQPYKLSPCAKGEHLVSGRACYRPGKYRCVNCFAEVDVPYPLSERAA